VKARLKIQLALKSLRPSIKAAADEVKKKNFCRGCFCETFFQRFTPLS